MPKYFAVIKKLTDSSPCKLTFTANTIDAAIESMLKQCGCKDTSELRSFDLHEIVENGNAYRPVATKLERSDKRVPLVVPAEEETTKTFMTEEVEVLPATVITEDSYEK